MAYGTRGIRPARVYAESSLCKLLGDFVEEAQLVRRTATEARTTALVFCYAWGCCPSCCCG